jgi:hypothetical protein
MLNILAQVRNAVSDYGRANCWRQANALRRYCFPFCSTFPPSRLCICIYPCLFHFSCLFSCIVTAIAEANLSDLVFSLGDAELALSHTFPNGTVVEHNFHNTNFTKNVTNFFTKILTTLGTSANNQAAHNIATATKTCANEPPTPHHRPLWEVPMVILFGSIAILLGGFVYCQRKIGPGKKTILNDITVFLRNKLGANGGEIQEDDDFSIIDDAAFRQDQSPEPINWSESLLYHPSLSPFVRMVVPFVLVANIALFISCNLAIGASVNIYVFDNGVYTQIASLFEFSLGNSVHDMWQAKVYILAVLIALFSGAWPYIKLLAMLYTWIMPVGVCSAKTREWILIWLDRLGKWSLIDAFVLAMMMVAFRFHLPLNSQFTIEVVVVPGFGFYGFLLATMSSLTMSHFILAYHRHTEMKINIDGSSVYTEALRLHPVKFALHGNNSEVGKVRCSLLGQFFTVLALIGTFWAMILGATTDSFKFTFMGAAGLLLGPNATTPYSLMYLGSTIADSALDPNLFGIRWIQWSFYAMALFTGLACLGSLLLLWFLPVSLKTQRQLFVLIEVFYAWSSIEVFLVSIAAACIELPQFAQFLIGDNCDAINKILAECCDVILHGDDTCFDVHTELMEGAWTLGFASLGFLVLSLGLMSATHVTMHDRTKQYALASSRPIHVVTSEASPSVGHADEHCLPSLSGAFASILTSLGMIHIEQLEGTYLSKSMTSPAAERRRDLAEAQTQKQNFKL